MKIIQIATLITPDGAYGGPVRVAVNQTRALIREGHDVVLAAGAQGFGRNLPAEYDGVPVKLFRAGTLPKLGFSGTVAPGLNSWLRANIDSADVIHIHMSRDLVTMPSALLARRRRVPYVLQTHGMVTPSNHRLAGPVDKAWTSPALNGAQRVLYLTHAERDGLERMATTSAQLSELPNGVPDFEAFPSKKEGSIEVLFLARLHARKRPGTFIEMAQKLHPRFPSAKFVLVGPDGGQGSAVQKAIKSAGIADFVTWEGAVSPEESASRISQCDVYVLPSINEPFPMSVLEALALAKPVVVTDTCGLSTTISKAEAGYVVDDTLESLSDAVATLIESGERRRRLAENARLLALSEFGMDRIARRLGTIYAEAGLHG